MTTKGVVINCSGDEVVRLTKNWNGIKGRLHEQGIECELTEGSLNSTCCILNSDSITFEQLSNAADAIAFGLSQ